MTTNSDSDPDNDTLVIVSADHECAGVALPGVGRPDKKGTRDYVKAYNYSGSRNDSPILNFTDYVDANGDGYPDNPDTGRKLIVNFGAGSDRYEDWMSSAKPKDPGVTQSGVVVANPNDPDKTAAGGYLVVGVVENGVERRRGPDAGRPHPLRHPDLGLRPGRLAVRPRERQHRGVLLHLQLDARHLSRADAVLTRTTTCPGRAAARPPALRREGNMKTKLLARLFLAALLLATAPSSRPSTRPCPPDSGPRPAARLLLGRGPSPRLGRLLLHRERLRGRVQARGEGPRGEAGPPAGLRRRPAGPPGRALPHPPAARAPPSGRRRVAPLGRRRRCSGGRGSRWRPSRSGRRSRERSASGPGASATSR